jgi:ParB family chromosome partitioning protein
LSVRETEKLVESLKGKRSVKERRRGLLRKAETTDPQLQAIESKLCRIFGTQVAIKARGRKGGWIQITYYSAEDLERLLELLRVSDKL